MSLNALALALALSGEAEAKPKESTDTPEVSTAQLLAQCKATSAVNNTLDRKQVEEMTPAFDEGFREALEDPSQRELQRALAQALLEALKEQVIEDGELTERMEKLMATLSDKIESMSAVDPNREEIKVERQETKEEQALLDLVLKVNGVPLKMKDLLVKYPQFAKLYELTRAEVFAEEFADQKGLDCKEAVRYAVLNNKGVFPAVRTDLVEPQTPEMELTVRVSAWPELEQVPGGANWRRGRGFEREEFEGGVTELTSEQARWERGEDKLKRRYALDGYTNVVVPVKFTVDDGKEEETPVEAPATEERE